MGRIVVILLDTHVLLWSQSEPKRLSQAARSAISEASKKGGISISAATLLEVSILARKRRIQVAGGLEAFLIDIETRATILPIQTKACVKLLGFPEDYPGDPIDQIIGATALAEGIPLVTADERIRKAKAFATIW